jgi:hypothetical protein
MKIALLTFLLFLLFATARAQHPVYGKVIDQESNQPLAGATLQASHARIQLTTDAAGRFSFSTGAGTVELTVTYFGYNNSELKANLPLSDSLVIRLKKTRTS